MSTVNSDAKLFRARLQKRKNTSHTEALMEEAVGNNLLSFIRSSAKLVNQRSEQVTFLDWKRAKRVVRVQIDLHSFAGGTAEVWPPWEGDDVFNLHETPLLVRWRGRLLVPLACLHPTADETFTVCNESGEFVPTLPPLDVWRFLRAGLMGITKSQLMNARSLGLLDDSRPDETLRDLLWNPSLNEAMLVRLMQTSGSEVARQQAAFLNSSAEFITFLRLTVEKQYLVVPVNPQRGAHRLFTYEHTQLLGAHQTSPPETDAKRSITRTRPFRIGRSEINVSVGNESECQYYVLEIGAPYDTVFIDGRMTAVKSQPAVENERTNAPVSPDIDLRVGKRPVLSDNRTIKVDGTSIRYATDSSSEIDTRRGIRANLQLVRTGPVRVAVYSAAFTVFVLGVGTVLAAFSEHYRIAPESPESGVALLLLVPGVLGGILATPSPHPITASLQFPTRRTLWAIGAISFVPAANVGLGWGGPVSIALWISSFIAVTFFFYLLIRQARMLKTDSDDFDEKPRS